MVRGAVTTAKLDGKSVVVTITSDDQKAASKIQMRADKLLADKATAKLAGDLPTPVHAQNGTHGGGIGICPVHVPEGATAKRTTIANGVSIKITPKSGAEGLEKDVEARIARAADWLKSNPNGDGEGLRLLIAERRGRLKHPQQQIVELLTLLGVQRGEQLVLGLLCELAPALQRAPAFLGHRQGVGAPVVRVWPPLQEPL